MNIIQNNYGIVNINLMVDDTVKKITKAKRINTSFFDALESVLIKNEKEAQAKYLKECGSFLKFRYFLNNEHTKKLIGANFCKNPLCPVCAWRKHIANQKALHEFINKSKNYIYHVVLAVPNTETLTKEQLRELKHNAIAFLKDESGLDATNYFLSLEIVYSETGFHPHLHIIIETNCFIKVDETYIKEMSKLWRLYADKLFTFQHFFTQSENGFTFYIRGINKSEAKSASEELTKYVLKPSNFEIVTENIIEQIYKSISNTHLLSAGGTIKKALSKIKTTQKIDESIEQEHLLNNFAFFDVIFNWLNSEQTFDILL